MFQMVKIYCVTVEKYQPFDVTRLFVRFLNVNLPSSSCRIAAKRFEFSDVRPAKKLYSVWWLQPIKRAIFGMLILRRFISACITFLKSIMYFLSNMSNQYLSFCLLNFAAGKAVGVPQVSPVRRPLVRRGDAVSYVNLPRLPIRQVSFFHKSRPFYRGNEAHNGEVMESYTPEY